MNLKTTALVAMMVPALAMMAACNHKTDADDAMPAATTPTDTMPADTMPADTMPADSTSSDGMQSDSMQADNGMAGDSMSSGDSMSGDAMNGDSMTGGDMTFAEMDKNGDGGISKDELAPTDMLYQHFSVADADGNGVLSEAEVTKHRADMAAMPAN